MHNLSGREIGSVEELENALDEVRKLVTAELAQGHKVRLV
jgi:hypothetical protein